MLDLPPPTQPESRPPAIVKPHVEPDLRNESLPSLGGDEIRRLLGSLEHGEPAFRVAVWPAVQQEKLQPPAPGPLPRPLPDRLKHSYYDGAFMGANGKMYGAGESPDRIPAVIPWTGIRQPGETIVFVNGMSTAPNVAQYNMQRIANNSGLPVIGIYNATVGDISDVLQVAMDKANAGTNPAVESLKKIVLHAVTHNQPLHLVGESHGALIVSRSIGSVRTALLSTGHSDTEVDEMLSKISVETFGGSAWHYPDGPRYVHYVNERDPIPFHFGLTQYGLGTQRIAEIHADLQEPDWVRNLARIVDVLDVNQIAGLHPGRDARIVRFSIGNDQDWLQTHMVDTYLQYRSDFDDAYSLQAPAKPAEFELWPAVKTTAKWLLVCAGVFWLSRWAGRAAGAMGRILGRKKPGDAPERNEGSE